MPGASRENIIGFFGVFHEAFPDIRLELHQLVADGPAAAAEGTLTGTHNGVLPTPNGDVAPTGRAVELRWAAIYAIDGDTLKSEHLFFDQMAGRVAVETEGGAVLDEGRLAGRQGRLVFAYLVAEHGRLVPRDELAEVLWGPVPPATWERALTVIASKLRSALTEVGVDGGSALTSASGCYRIELPAGSWVDLTAAAVACDEAEHALAAGESQRARAAAALAGSLLRLPLLPGEDGAWVEEKRRELADVRVRALTVLSDACLGLGDAASAAKWAEQAIALEPFRESGYRRLMKAHAAAGNRAEARVLVERTPERTLRSLAAQVASVRTHRWF